MHGTEVATQAAVDFGVKLLAAVAIAIAGLLATRWAGAFAARWLERRPLDVPVRHLLVGVVRAGIVTLTLIAVLDKLGIQVAPLVGVVRAGIVTLTLIAVLDKLGIQVAPLVAGLGIAGLGLGFALQGILGDLIAGLYIMAMKPFAIGEYLELLGVQGQVVDIGLLATTLMPPDASRIVIPNKKIIGEVLHRYGSARQLTLRVSVTSGSDLQRALVAVRAVVGASPRVLKDPAPVTAVETVSATITIVAKAWVAIVDWEVAQAELYPAIVERLRRDGIPPFGAPTPA